MQERIEDYALRFIRDEVLEIERMKYKREFRSRARDLYSTAYFEGLIPTLVFAFSKAKEENVRNLFNNKNSLKENEEGYGFYIFGIFKFLKECLQIDIKDCTVDSLIQILKDKSVENKIFTYMKWLKYIAEAKIEDKENVTKEVSS